MMEFPHDPVEFEKALRELPNETLSAVAYMYEALVGTGRLKRAELEIVRREISRRRLSSEPE